MSENLGKDVSYVNETAGYAHDMVVFQKGKPPLDSEINLAQELKNLLSARQMKATPSGWLTFRPFYTSTLLENKFYTQNPSTAIPEYALVNGKVIYITNTATSEVNSNLIDLKDPPATGARVNGVFLEVWRALLDPDTSDNRPDPETIIDALKSVDAIDENNAWAVGENGLVLNTDNGGRTWTIQIIDSKRNFNKVYFINSTVGWLVGDGGVIGRTTSGGDRWSVIQSGYVENLNSVFAATQLIAWAVGDGGIILKTTNTVNWSPLSSGTTVNINNIFFKDSLVGWIVGDDGLIKKTTDGGTHWITLTSGTTQDLYAVYFYDLNFGFAVGANGTILRSSDGGLSWVNQSGNIYEDSVYKSLSVDYTDVTMIPNLDQYVNGEDVSSQFSGSNKNCTVLNVPITKGDGLGTTTNLPADIVVKVAGTAVLVDSVVGATGHIILHEAPRACDEVKVYYYYKISTEIFRGMAWITGKEGTVLKSIDIGAEWIPQVPDTSYDLYGVNFANQSKGWVVGAFSIIRHTEDGGATWTEQKSDAIARVIQRVYYEGNKDTVIYLNDNSLHPDTDIETTKRVQIQYRIRVADNVDPFNYPEAGLGSTAVVGLGPNSSGSYAFENMGATEGDYGLWRAKCSNTVDGYCWAIPMFFVNRRNSTSYNPSSNANGSNEKKTVNIRPDKLTGINIVDSDILDVRRKIFIPSVKELLDMDFDRLMSNSLKTNFVRNTLGGDKYGTEILQLDRIGGTTTDGGELIIDATLSAAVGGSISSGVTVEYYPGFENASTSAPTEKLFDTLGNGSIYHPNRALYRAYYGNAGNNNNKPIPGYFEGIGTNELKFVYSVNTLTQIEDSNITKYNFVLPKIVISTKALSRIPSDPKLVKNYRTGSPSFFYQGVFDTDTSGKVVEQWDSGIPGYTSYTLAYPGIKTVSDSQTARASTVEVHEYRRVISDDIVGGPFKLEIEDTVTPDTLDEPYDIYTISKINNITSGYSYKIKDIAFSTGLITIESESGFPFIEGTVIEVVSMATSKTGNSNIRNGATVNFIPDTKGIDIFCKSEILSKTISSPTTTITFDAIAGGTVYGISSVETTDSLTQPVCWVANVLTPVTTITGLGTSTLELELDAPVSGTVTVQVMIIQAALEYSNPADGLHIGYNYIPYQTVASLPTTLTVAPVLNPDTVCISNLGTGGSLFSKVPYSFPLENIPTQDPLVVRDNEFYNIDLLRFPTFSVDGGFVQMPIYVTGTLGDEFMLSVPALDYSNRTYYSVCSKEFKYTTEAIRIGLMRKIFVPLLGRVISASDNKLLKGEYVLLIVSRNALMETDNYTGYEAGEKSVIAVYRLSNKPLSRI